MKFLSTLLLTSLSFLNYAQSSYRGIVVDSLSMNALQGVHITVKGSSKGTSTNEAGQFTISAKAIDTLVFSYLGYASLELPLLLEEDVLFVRLREQISLLQEITIKATRLYPNEIVNRTREAPRKMEKYQAFQSPFTYFSKTEKEKRKVYRYIEETNKTQTFVQVITDPIVKEIFMKEYNLSEEEYSNLLAKFNETQQRIHYSTDPEEIMEALHTYFSSIGN